MMKKILVCTFTAFTGLALFAPPSQGGSAPAGDETALAPARKSGSCKERCFHQEATCRGKRGACMAARQRCVRSCS
jgi:hypothetical protein